MESNLRMASLRGSLRNGSVAWRTTSTRQMFGQSSREEDDEEALMWAALEKLPTYDRVRRGILTSTQGELQEVDIHGLGMHDRKHLLERLVRMADEDNEQFLLKLRSRMDLVGIENPTIEVRYENLNVDAEAYVGNRSVPTFLNFFSNKITHDVHIGEMTVRETLAFSARCQGVGTRYDMLTELSRREKEANIKPDPDVDLSSCNTSRATEL